MSAREPQEKSDSEIGVRRGQHRRQTLCTLGADSGNRTELISECLDPFQAFWFKKFRIVIGNEDELIPSESFFAVEVIEQMGIIGYCDTDVEQLSANDQVVAEQFDRDIRARMREIESVAAG